MRCHACKARASVERQFQKSDDKTAADGLHTYITEGVTGG